MSQASDTAYDRAREMTRDLFDPIKNSGHAFLPIEDLQARCQKCLKSFSIIALMERKLPPCEVA